jgi:hypothetical protein
MAALKKEQIVDTAQGVARKRRATGKPVYPARPTQEAIDFAALRKDIMKSFPKTLAYLAR